MNGSESSERKGRPFLTTAVPVRNGATFIDSCLKSLAGSRRLPDRVVVLDNVSTDNTLEKAKAFKEKFKDRLCVEMLASKVSLSMAENWNRALGLASETDFLHILHADDMVGPEFYEKALEEMGRSTKDRALAFTLPIFVNDAEVPVKTRFPIKSRVKWLSAREFIGYLAELKPIYCPGVILKTSRQPSPALFRDDLPQLLDIMFYGMWAHSGAGIVELPSHLVFYREHAESATASNTRNMSAFVRDERKVMKFMGDLVGKSLLWHEKAKLLFAARQAVKIKRYPTLAPEIRKATLECVPHPYYWLGRLAAAILR